MSTQPSDVLDLLDSLVRIESVNPLLDPSGSGESEIASFVAEWGRRHGLSAELVEGTPGRPSVLLRGGRNVGGRRLVLCGHLDTVGIGGNADGITPRVEGDRMYARGAYDMKAGLAACLIAARDAVAAGIDGEVIVAAAADEEASSIGIEDLLGRLDTARIDGAVVSEPTERQIGIAHRGFAWTEVTVTGVAAHGSRPHLGADAIMAAGHVIVAFDEFDRELRTKPHRFLGPGNLHGSLIEGGSEGSTIPDRCVFSVERRTLPGETLEQIEADVAGVLERARPSDERITVTSRTVAFREGMETPEDALIVQKMLAAAGEGSELVPLSYWADSALLSTAGIPTVLFGPEGEGAHADVEWVSLSGTVTAAEVLTRLTMDFCG
ncbi:M20/M25/M40 family metallo-hydrolase [Ammonicoccus fulvus]|uniref:M20/M25/M40 family metallo-hydrolase n=1 Tax=Ammonicoccus fulvus TaxID=3138240 RepID=A0ABZ3FSA8_9ACTN